MGMLALKLLSNCENTTQRNTKEQKFYNLIYDVYVGSSLGFGTAHVYTVNFTLIGLSLKIDDAFVSIHSFSVFNMTKRQ